MAFLDFYCLSGGSNLNSGTTEDAAAPLTYAGGTFVRGTVTFTVASGNPVTDGVVAEDIISVYTTAGATVATCLVLVSSRTATTFTGTVIAGAAANVSETANAATAKKGGAWAGPSGTVGFPWNFVSGTTIKTAALPPHVNFKNSAAYNITANVTQTLTGPVYWRGYNSTPRDGGKALFFGDSATPAAPFTILTNSGANNYFDDLHFDNNGGDAAGQSVGNNCMVDNSGTGCRFETCRFSNAYRAGLRQAGGGTHINRNEFYGNNRDDAQNFGGLLITEECEVFHNVFHTHTAGTDSNGITMSADNTENVTIHGNIFYNHAGEAILLTGNHNSVRISHNLFHTAVSGVRFSGAAATGSNVIIENNIFWNCTGEGINNNNANHRSGPIIRNNAFGDIDGDDVDTNINTSFVSGTSQITVDPCEAAATGDFRLNNNASGGALCRNAGLGTFSINTALLAAGASTVSLPDLGPVEADAGEGGASFVSAVTGTPIASINGIS